MQEHRDPYVIVRELRERHPETDELLGELGEAIIAKSINDEEMGALRQCRTIMAALTGDLMAHPGCVPSWDDDTPTNSPGAPLAGLRRLTGIS